MRAVFLVVFFVALTSSASASGNLECEGCKWITGKVQKYLENNAKITNFTVNLLDNDVCAHFPEKVAAQCDTLVAAYVPQAITSLETKFLDPTFLCTEVAKLCTAMQHFDLASNRVQGDAECNLCTKAAGYISSILASNATEAELTADVSKLCNQLPAKYALLCSFYVNRSGPMIIERIGELIASDGCVDLHLCSAPSKAEAFEIAMRSDNLECKVCDLIMNELQSVVENSTSLDALVENFLETNLCGNLPTSFQSICNSTVATETPAILFDVAQKFLGADACVKVGVCKNTSQSVQLNGNLECEICSKLVDFAAGDFFLNPKAITFVSKEISDICSSIHISCDHLAQEVAPKLMQAIGGFLANNACTWIHACTKA